MRAILVILLLLYFSHLRSQPIDSAWTAKAYLERFTRDTGMVLPETNLVDPHGKKRSLEEFTGKILFVDIWTTWCGSCIEGFAHQKKLVERLKAIHVDTAIQFLTICTEDEDGKWKKLLRKHDPEGVHLFATDSSIHTSWHINSFPNYMLLDRSGKILIADAPGPDDAIVDYILYAAANDIKPVTALWIHFRQNDHFNKNRSFTNDTEGMAFLKWHQSIVAELYKYSLWRQKRNKKSSAKSP
jgi:thiol-disulfide isomerase/thioredoxin